jgi:hypothetical protein
MQPSAKILYMTIEHNTINLTLVIAHIDHCKTLEDCIKNSLDSDEQVLLWLITRLCQMSPGIGMYEG